MLLLLYTAPPLMSLSALEGGNEGVRERGLASVEERRWGGGEPIEGHIEAELKGSALERVRRLVGMRFEASPPEHRCSGAEQSGGYVEGSDLGMATPSGEAEGVF